MTGMVSNKDLLNWIPSYCEPGNVCIVIVIPFSSTEDLPRTGQTPPFLITVLRRRSIRDQAGPCVFLTDIVVYSLFTADDVKIRVSWSRAIQRPPIASNRNVRLGHLPYPMACTLWISSVTSAGSPLAFSRSIPWSRITSHRSGATSDHNCTIG